MTSHDNDECRDEAVLKEGDIIQIGDSAPFIFNLDDSPPLSFDGGHTRIVGNPARDVVSAMAMTLLTGQRTSIYREGMHLTVGFHRTTGTFGFRVEESGSHDHVYIIHSMVAEGRILNHDHRNGQIAVGPYSSFIVQIGKGQPFRLSTLDVEKRAEELYGQGMHRSLTADPVVGLLRTFGIDPRTPDLKAAVKRAYKELVRHHHPDVNKRDSNSAERFRKISDVYRAICDWYGWE